MSLGRWEVLGSWHPDIVCILFAKKEIAISPESQSPLRLSDVGRLSPMARWSLTSRHMSTQDGKSRSSPWMVGARAWSGPIYLVTDTCARVP